MYNVQSKRLMEQCMELWIDSNERRRDEFTRVYDLIRQFFRCYALTRFVRQIRQCLISWITSFLAARKADNKTASSFRDSWDVIDKSQMLGFFSWKSRIVYAKINAVFWSTRRVKGSFRKRKKPVLARCDKKVSRDNVKKYLKEKDWSAPRCVKLTTRCYFSYKCTNAFRNLQFLSLIVFFLSFWNKISKILKFLNNIRIHNIFNYNVYNMQ